VTVTDATSTSVPNCYKLQVSSTSNKFVSADSLGSNFHLGTSHSDSDSVSRPECEYRTRSLLLPAPLSSSTRTRIAPNRGQHGGSTYSHFTERYIHRRCRRIAGRAMGELASGFQEGIWPLSGFCLAKPGSAEYYWRGGWDIARIRYIECSNNSTAYRLLFV
jgi:hypothetical protein